MCMYVYCAFVWRPEINLKCHFSGATRLVFSRSLTGLELIKETGLPGQGALELCLTPLLQSGDSKCVPLGQPSYEAAEEVLQLEW